MNAFQTFTFFDKATTPGSSSLLPNPNGSTLILSVSGEFVGTLIVNGQQGSAVHRLSVIDLSTFDQCTSISAPGAYAVVCPYGFEYISVLLNEYTSGAVTVTGRLSLN